MLPAERRAAVSLAAIYMFRMMGLFIVLPVFSLFASEYAHSTPFLIGLAIGVYGPCGAKNDDQHRAYHAHCWQHARSHS